MIKFLFKIFISIIILILLTEIILYVSGGIRYKKERNLIKLPALTYSTNPIILFTDEPLLYLECRKNKKCQKRFRFPDGLKYKNNKPILVFGCSFAHGDNYLKQNQTFSYKLSELLKRPVYNRAAIGFGLAEMYYQTLNKEFYKLVPKTDTVIYIMMSDHYRRMLSYKFDPLEDFFRIRFTADKNNNLIADTYNNPLKNFLKSTYISGFYNAIWAKTYIRNTNNKEKLTDLALLFFIKSREELEKNMNNKINFIVVFYNSNDIQYVDILSKKLIKNNFKVIKTKDITNEILSKDKYMYKGHPSEKAWNLLTPLIAKQI